MIVYEGKPLDINKAILRYFSEWQGKKKRHLKHLQRIGCNKRVLIQRREISILRDVIHQIHILQEQNKKFK